MAAEKHQAVLLVVHPEAPPAAEPLLLPNAIQLVALLAAVEVDQPPVADAVAQPVLSVAEVQLVAQQDLLHEIETATPGP